MKLTLGEGWNGKFVSAYGIRDEILNTHLNKQREANGGVSTDSSQALALTVLFDV